MQSRPIPRSYVNDDNCLTLRLADLHHAVKILTTPFTLPLMRAIADFIDGGQSLVFEAGTHRLRPSVADCLSKYSDPRMRLHTLTEVFMEDLRPPAKREMDRRSTLPGWNQVRNRLDVLGQERDELGRIFLAESRCVSPVALRDEKLDVVVHNIFSVLFLKRRWADVFLRKCARHIPAISEDALMRGLCDPAIDMHFSRGKTAAASLALEALLSGCNQECFSQEPEVVSQLAGHRKSFADEYDSDVHKFSQHLGSPWADEKFFDLDHSPGYPVLVLRPEVWDRQALGYPPGMTLNLLCERERKHHCPAVIGGGIPELVELYGKAVSHPAVSRYFLHYYSTA